MPDMASVYQGYNNSIPSLVLLLTSCLASRKPAKYHAVIICTSSAGEASIIIDLSVQFFIFCFKIFFSLPELLDGPLLHLHYFTFWTRTTSHLQNCCISQPLFSIVCDSSEHKKIWSNWLKRHRPNNADAINKIMIIDPKSPRSSKKWNPALPTYFTPFASAGYRVFSSIGFFYLGRSGVNVDRASHN